ncbi:MAG TPA: tryptophan--tRNA ligase [Candidatus Magasanikbacteria bacterium]|nr:MAG: tryptophan--tRNA ligase [Candidatus Magasanikbacteria bacterium RIFCSPLOWO2_02_FULL_47_16]OGH79801.1 MAG: tryptophan--tRNA ligase [Candidatus Magasanikbacteria bacterium RIFCSPHIGHO2_02_FULL_48_18]HAZ28657.1 tryptophan--tRNA ligase [Candidatus Magasanikbacteria bacterium]
MPKPVLFSGIQPTGNLHIGNYLGAVKQMIDFQNTGEYTMYYFIADLHSLTGNMTPEERGSQVFITAAELLAAGIDPKKTTMFVQSHVREHTELAWIFETLTPIAELERMTQFKDKSIRQAKNINAGLFTYPILQAADILLYHGTVVPVGEDQVQHVELTRDIARWFNKKYGEYFAEVKHVLTNVPRVKSLLDPNKKMSKSLGAGHVIELADEPDVIQKKLSKAVTATEGGGKAPGVDNLLLLLKQFGTEEQYQEFVAAEKKGTIQYGALKSVLAESIADTFAEFREKRASFVKNTKKLNAILEENAEHARLVAAHTMKDVRKRVGLV